MHTPLGVLLRAYATRRISQSSVLPYSQVIAVHCCFARQLNSEMKTFTHGSPTGEAHMPHRFTQRRFTLKALTAAVALSGLTILPAHAQSGGTIKVGILHSLSGTMEIGRAHV